MFITVCWMLEEKRAENKRKKKERKEKNSVEQEKGRKFKGLLGTTTLKIELKRHQAFSLSDWFFSDPFSYYGLEILSYKSIYCHRKSSRFFYTLDLFIPC